MSPDSSDFRRWSRALSKAARAVRSARASRAHDVAERMGLALRTYEHFESGGGRLNLERIFAFAAATDSDAFAILTAALIQAPELAARSARNKLVLTFMLALKEFDSEVGDDIDLLETGVLLGAFTQMFTSLAGEAKRRRETIATVEQRAKNWGADISHPRAED
jgi:transcriptional regulator with XRE-family HTH domain